MVAGEIEWKKVNGQVKSFIEKIQDELKKRDYSEFIGEFHTHKKIDFDKLSNMDKFNDKLDHHPILLWLIEKRT